MKAIYINIDPYIAAFAAWVKSGEVGPAPHFDPLPLAVTIPLGESAAIFKEAAVDSDDWAYVWSTVDGVSIGVKAVTSSDPTPGEAGVIASDVVPGLSAITPSAKYGVFTVSGDTTVTVYFNDGDIDYPVVFTVLVRRETASGPVDLVDFTPPSSAADIRSALVAAGDGALKGVSLGGAIIIASGSPATPGSAGPTLVSPNESVDPDNLKVLDWSEGNSVTLGAAVS